jgi:hypothetical protein
MESEISSQKSSVEPVLSQMNPIHIFATYFLKVHSRSILWTHLRFFFFKFLAVFHFMTRSFKASCRALPHTMEANFMLQWNITRHRDKGTSYLATNPTHSAVNDDSPFYVWGPGNMCQVQEIKIVPVVF